MVHRTSQECKRWLHVDPQEPMTWLLAALLCLHCAHNAPSVPAFKRAQVLAARALSRLDKGRMGCEGVLAACALSEAYLQLATFDVRASSSCIPYDPLVCKTGTDIAENSCSRLSCEEALMSA